MAGSRVHAQTQPVLDLKLYGGITITGAVGVEYAIQYVPYLAETNAWLTLTNITLPRTPYLFVDTSTNADCAGGKRFYRAVAQLTNYPQMMLIPGGSFLMGSTFAEEEFPERVTHQVTVSAFYMDKYLVTRSRWYEVASCPTCTGYVFNVAGGKGSNHPVHSITWYDAVKWCNARSQMDGLKPCYYTNAALTEIYKAGEIEPYVDWNANGYRLPTEAEWEKAARGGLSGNRFPWGNEIRHTNANYYSDTDRFPLYDFSPTSSYHPVYNDGAMPYTSPVGSFASNNLGLFDMAGNISQWCWDWFDGYWYYNTNATEANTRGPVDPSGLRVLRGGSWDNYANKARAAARDNGVPSELGWTRRGFRCVRAF